MSDITGQNKSKKPFYKKWWFWVIAAIFLIILVGSLSGKNEDNRNGSQNNTQGSEATQGAEDVGINEKGNTAAQNGTNPTVTSAPQNNENTTAGAANNSGTGLTRDNSTAKLTVLNTGSFLAGTDIPVGRYVITGDGSGNLFIYDTAGIPYVNEILGSGDLGVDSVTTNINKGDKIEISGIDKVTFTPAGTELHKDTLTTGSWIVGLDFAAGRYDVSSNDGNGNFFVYDKSSWPIVNEILGGGDIGVDKVTVDLKDGYTITIGGMDEVLFTKK